MKTDREFLEELNIDTTNLISFEKISKQKIKDKCQHFNLSINASEEGIDCKDCGEKLNPMWVLCNYAEYQKSVYKELRQQLIRVKNIEKELEKKQRTKCKHCGRFTPVNIQMSDSQWWGFDVVK